MKTRIRTKLVLVLVALVLVPMLIFSLFTVRLSINAALENSTNYQINSMKKIGSAVDSLFQELDRASLFLIGDGRVRSYLSQDGEDPAATASSVYNVLGYLSNNSTMIKSIQVENNDGEILYRGSLPLSITEEDRSRAIELLGRPFWDVETDTAGEDYIYLCRLLRDTRDTRRHLGIVKIYLNLAGMQSFFRNEYDPSTAYYILDSEGRTVFSGQTGEDFPALEQIGTGQLARAKGASLRWTHADVPYYLSSYPMPTNDWYTVSLSSTQAVRGQISASILMLAVLAAACLLFCVLLAILISRGITKPLLEITQRMKDLEAQDFSVRVPVKGNDEIALLARQFNRMTERIQVLVEEVYVAELRHKESQLRALQAQMNPHFLYNTLDMVYWNAKMENAQVTSEQIESLSRFFRLALADRGDYSTVAEEIEHLRYYIILRQQSGNSFEFDLEADPDCLGCRVIKLVLQPMVENAILHGIAGMEDGRIRVCISHREDTLYYTTSDNGKGLDPAELETLLYAAPKGHRGFGIRNVNDRIQLTYGPNYGLLFENLPGGGAKVTVKQPFIRDEETTHDQDNDR
ncbi:sensor histidine kinase [Ruminococcaceae bacterium OttesenSCG-928-D13]|nr:sensor histidine kinase [Ruminococcaceae bacterium OttesenSCG-928-D13]